VRGDALRTSVAAFRSAYVAKLAAHLADPGEVGLHGAYELGRDAVARDLSVLDVAAVHHDVLLEECRDAAATEVQRVLGAAGDFLLELLSVFEVVRRGIDEARAAAVAERRSSDMLRRLSRLLADPSLAVETDSFEEALRLVAEEASELTHAATSLATAKLDEDRVLTAIVGDVPSRITAPRALAARRLLVAPGLDAVRMSRREVVEGGVLAPGEETLAWLAAPLRYLNGGEFGLVEVFAGDDFSDLDEAMLVHLADISSAALERATLYRPANPRGRLATAQTDLSQHETDVLHGVLPGYGGARQHMPEES
jgi:GAF domain-containing protein